MQQRSTKGKRNEGEVDSALPQSAQMQLRNLDLPFLNAIDDHLQGGEYKFYYKRSFDL